MHKGEGAERWVGGGGEGEVRHAFKQVHMTERLFTRAIDKQLHASFTSRPNPLKGLLYNTQDYISTRTTERLREIV